MPTEYVICECVCRAGIWCACGGNVDGGFTKRQADEKIRADPLGIKYVAKYRWSKDGDLLADDVYWNHFWGYDQ